ncbi:MULTISPECIES: Scr1 family TA system antitoxin-like transcriptional regulator [Streptomyces]|uniref:Scr1 family TA system antitoxin-like transcriptional regulator n=1 Tax=Streptomyces TaxID=1883 RepID=UPI00163BDCA9|nr:MULTISPECIES: Scr1 family TA system antitoxin-like transcriptional regulator [Streptomyces]MBC2874048.1 helix-turn-helix domain-containing protein [Streptomyces sp. TYQ1024]UBI39017.1 helix-turn-helix domain-containing protein [Streptomyces mobaraensis]UKW31595.1 helix-turn-helix domain-containing protein [Streptomyces sp. TYQ1024]
MNTVEAAPAARAAAVVVGAYLRFLRERMGRTLHEAGRAVRRTASTISRIETRGALEVTGADVDVLLRLYGLPATRVEAVHQLLDARGEMLYDPGDGWHDRLAAVERMATAISTYQATVIPAALRTAAYDAALMVIGRDHSAPLRRRFLKDPPQRRPPGLYTAFLDTSVLRRPMGGPEVMADQLDHLLTLLQSRRIGLRVVPTEAGPVGWDTNTSRLRMSGLHLYVTEGWGRPRYSVGGFGRPEAGLPLRRAARFALGGEETVEVVRQARTRMAMAVRPETPEPDSASPFVDKR